MKVESSRVSAFSGQAGMLGQLLRERIRRVDYERGRLDNVQRRRLWRAPSEELLESCERQPVQPRAVAGELELVRRIAQERMAEQVDSL